MEAVLDLPNICYHRMYPSQGFSFAVLCNSFIASQLQFGSQAQEYQTGISLKHGRLINPIPIIDN